MRNSRNTHRQTWITAYRVVTMVLLVTLVVIGGNLLTRPAPTAPTAAEIAQAVNGPEVFERPSGMEYVAKTDSCVVGGTITSSQWHVGQQVVAVGEVDSKTVSYTSFGFMADNGQTFTVTANDALFTDPGENIGVELHCDPQTMETNQSFGLVRIIWGGK